MKIFSSISVCLVLVACVNAPAAPPGAASSHIAVPTDAEIEALMQKARVPGLSIARIESCSVADIRHFGVEDVETGTPVTGYTAFEAASLTKTVFATLVMNLAAEGVIDLDEPLAASFDYVRVPGKALYGQLTPRIILQHRSGFPNWVSDPTDPETWGEIEFKFEPGEQFGYSGEAFQMLQAYVEARTGKSLDLLFVEHFGSSLRRTSLSEPVDDMSLAFGHDNAGSKSEGRALRYMETAGAAFSMNTTAGDYAGFLASLCDGGIFVPDLASEMWTASSPTKDTRISWGLGWGIQTGEAPIVFHWGDNGPFKAFVALNPASEDGIVFFANAQNGLTLIEAIAEPVLGDLTPIIDWLDYGRPEDIETPVQPERKALIIDKLPEDFVHTGGEPREAASIDMIVIHTIGGPLCEAGEIRFADVTGSAVYWRDWFLQQDDKSIHYVIGRDGAIAQQRPDLRSAGHVSYHGVKPDVNKRSIGIELLNNGDGLDPFPEIQIEVLTTMVKELAEKYSLGPDDIYRHSELDPRKLSGCGDNYRRVDPGPLFPMDELKAALGG